MTEKILYSIDTPYRQKFEIRGFEFGSGEASCAIVGSLRGDEVQQMYTCSRVVKALRKLEQEKAIIRGRSILVIPCVNYFSMNVGSRFWPMDGADLNRLFPGNAEGETSSRISGALFEAVKDYEYGIQFISPNLPGDFPPHIRVMETGYTNMNLGNLFGLPFVQIRTPRPIDTATLNYNWQMWQTHAFSIYTQQTSHIVEEEADVAVSAALRFLSRVGIIKYQSLSGYVPTIFADKELATMVTPRGGIFRRLANPGDEVAYGDLIAEILDPLTAEVIARMKSPTKGVIFYAMRKPLVTEHEIAFKIIRRMHR